MFLKIGAVSEMESLDCLDWSDIIGSIGTVSEMECLKIGTVSEMFLKIGTVSEMFLIIGTVSEMEFLKIVFFDWGFWPHPHMFRLIRYFVLNMQEV